MEDIAKMALFEIRMHHFNSKLFRDCLSIINTKYYKHYEVARFNKK